MTLKINQIKNKRIVVLGKSGIVASNLLFKLDKFNLKNIPIGRSKVNLKQKGSYKKLRKIIKNGDIIIFVAAEAPVKNIEMFFNNLKICKTVCNALESKKIDTIVDDTDENYSSKMKKFNLIGVPYQIIIGKKSEGDLFEFKEIGKESQNLSIDQISELINKQKEKI